jgi:Carboxypeptidase regulatory-like domain
MQRKLIVSILFVLMVTAAGLGQTATTTLHGNVRDAQGAVVPNATVTIANKEQGFSRQAQTDTQGNYSVPQLPPGNYLVTTTAVGFTKVEQPITLLVNIPATQDVVLQVAASSTTVEVTGEAAPTINTQDASVGNAVTRVQIESLPFEGRDPAQILSLQPGVTFVGNNVDPNQDPRQGAVNGARSDQTNIVLDGVDNNDEAGLGQPFQGALRTPLDSIQELRVTTSNANAEAGRSSGAQVIEVTRSGTNAFHGSVYEYNRGLVRQANDWFNKQSELQNGQPNIPGKLVRNTFGARFGGPLWKDRVFFFLNYEGQRTRQTQTVVRTVPTPSLKQGFLKYTAADNSTVTLSPAQIASMDTACGANCPWGGGPNPNILQIFQTYPDPNNYTASGDGLNTAAFIFAAPTPAKIDVYLARFDINVDHNGKHRIFFKPQMQNIREVPANGGAPQFPGQAPSINLTDNGKGFAIGYTAVLSNTVVNNFRFGYTRQGIARAGTQNQNVVTFRGLDQPFAQTATNWIHLPVKNITDDVNWVKGNHTLQFGGNIRLLNTYTSNNSNSFLGGETNVSWLEASGIANQRTSLDPSAFGFPTVADNFTNNYDTAVVNLAGLVTEGFSNYNRDNTGAVLATGAPATRHFVGHEWEGYIQDSWRMKPNFTVTYGVRYTYLGTPYEANGTQVVPNVSTRDWFNSRAAAMVQGQGYEPLISYELGGAANHAKPYWNAQKANFAPRIAFAWSPGWDSGIAKAIFGGRDRSSIRAGYGIYYDHFGEGIVTNFNTSGSFGLATQLSNPAGILTPDSVPRFTGLYNLPSDIILPPPSGGFPYTPPSTLDTGGFEITWGLDDKLKTPYAHVFNLGWQRELPKGFVFEADYIGRLGRHLITEIDYAQPENIVDPSSGMDYFSAATMFAKAYNAGTPVNAISPIPYWENMFPGAAGAQPMLSSGKPAFGCAGTAAGNLTATQALYDVYSCNVGNETSALYYADVLGIGADPNNPVFSKLGPYAYYHPQFSSLYVQSSIGTSSYNGAQFMLRRQVGALQFQFNYTLSRSEDMGSNPERFYELSNGSFGYSSQVINAWSPKQLYAPSDYDTRHQINVNWVYQLPLGKGKRFAGGAGRLLDALVGGWQWSGLWRWTSGYPFSVQPGLGYWPTDWQLTSLTVLSGTKPKTGTYMLNGVTPNVFQNPNNPDTSSDPTTAVNQFRFAYPGESGQRNILRGPGTFDIDTALAKSFKITERQALSLAVDAYNVTNSVRFDVGSLQTGYNISISNGSQFGNFSSTLSQPRVLEFSARYTF